MGKTVYKIVTVRLEGAEDGEPTGRLEEEVS